MAAAAQIFCHRGMWSWQPCSTGCLDCCGGWQTGGTEALLVQKAQSREHLLKIRDNERFHLKPQLAPILKHPLSLQVWTWSDSSVDAPWWWYQGAFSRDMSSRAPLCPLAQRPKAGAMLYPFQCLYDFSSNKTVAVCCSLTVYLILLHTHYRKSQSARGCMLMLSMSKMAEEILAKPNQSCARFR